jgi:hypothetical protein
MSKKFKDTKFNKFLGKVASTGLDVLPIITKAGTGNITGAISDAVSLLSGQDTTEATTLLDELVIQKKNIELDYYRVMQKNVTDRWKTDMSSDSWLSKNIRPLTLAWLIVSVTTICILDSAAALTVKEYWVTMFSSLLMTVVVAYFGGRSYEKGKKIK